MSTLLQARAPEGTEAYCGLVGRHPLMRDLFDRMHRAATHRFPVLIVGETGVGKELVARAMHQLSGARGPLVPLNVAALPEHLAEAELFGTVRGAFTGAVDRQGLIEVAAGGTLFLDEASELSLGTQVRLLRALESYTVRRVGGRHENAVCFRLLLSLQRPAATLVASGAWRDDFCHRVDGITLVLPPLRERPEDIPLLVNHTLQQLRRPPLPEPDLRALERYAWPGNVRELIRFVERAVFAAGEGPVTHAHLDVEVGRVGRRCSLPCGGTEAGDQAEERAKLERILGLAGSTKAAASQLGLAPFQLYRRFKALGITPPRLR